MSYDLYFRPRKKAPSVKTLRAWFKKRPNYHLHPDRAGYENERTGVYFGFDFDHAHEAGELPIAFNLNFFRPHVFGLEAEPELTAFVEEFELDVSDPQSDGMGDGPYSPAGFLRGWNKGNHFGYRACLAKPEDRPDEVFSLPRAKNAGVWRWNYACDPVLQHHDDNLETLPPLFYPTAMLFLDAARSQVVTGAFWTLDMAVALPQVDLVVTRKTQKSDELLAAPLDALLPLLDVHSEWDKKKEFDGRPLGMHAWLIEEPAVKTKLRKELLPKLKPIGLGRLPTDQVLDRDWVDEVMR